MKVARDQKRNSIIYEINPNYIEIIKDKVQWNDTRIDLDTTYEVKIRNPITN